MENQIFGLEDLQDIIKEVKNQFSQEIINNTNSTLLDYLIATSQYLIESLEAQNLDKNNKNFQFSKAAEPLLEQGFRFVYLTREFLTQEEMLFIYTIKNKNNDLVMKQLSLQELFKSISFQFENNSQLVSLQKRLSEIGKVYEQTHKHTKSLPVFINKVLELGTVKKWKEDTEENILTKNSSVQQTGRFMLSKRQMKQTIEKRKAHRLYQKKTPDTKVYVFYYGNRHQRGYYYNARQKNFYNEGWLNEWAQRIYEDIDGKISNDDNVMDNFNYVENCDNIKSIARIIYGIDNDLGSLTGDIQRLIQAENSVIRQQLQLKTQLNRHIISFQQILSSLKIIYELLIKIKEISTENNNNIIGEKSSVFKDLVINIFKSTNETANSAYEELCKTFKIEEQKT